jgi:hypothetical protein
VGADETAFPGECFNHALTLELGVGFGDGIAIDAEFFRQGTDRRQRLARPNGAGCGGGFHLVNELQVNGFAGLEIEVKSHSFMTGGRTNCHMTV